jgi:hypothetical protein
VTARAALSLAGRGAGRAVCFIRCPAGHLIIITLQLSETATCAVQAHLGPRCIRGLRGHTYRVSRSGFGIQIWITQSGIVLTIMRGRSGSQRDALGQVRQGSWCWAASSAMVVSTGNVRPETTKGHLVSPGGPHAVFVHWNGTSGWNPPGWTYLRYRG